MYSHIVRKKSIKMPTVQKSFPKTFEKEHAYYKIQVLNVTSCYRCPIGAVLTYSGIAKFGEPPGDVKCQDGTFFVARCSPNSITHTISLRWPYHEIFKINKHK
jgi:hypothetical protein